VVNENKQAEKFDIEKTEAGICGSLKGEKVFKYQKQGVKNKFFLTENNIENIECFNELRID